MLDIQHLNKKYGKFYAVQDLNLHINRGELFGFVGHNGAGKTTTIKIVAGLLDATSGQVYVDGQSAFANRNQIKRKIGYVPDFFGVYDNLTAMEYMEFYASMYGIVGKQAHDTCLALIDLVNLSDKVDAYVDNLSRGMKQRLCLARSLVHDPELLILDEPASGLDPRARFEMKEIMKNLRAMGKTIIISSHILPELADMCDTIGIMQQGSLVMYGTVADMERRAMHARPIHIRANNRLDEIEHVLKEDPRSGKISVLADEVVVEYEGTEEDAAGLLSRIVTQGIPVSGFYREHGNLETLFMEVTSGNIPEEQSHPQPMQQAPQGYGQPQPMQQAPQGYAQPRPMQQASQGYGQPHPMQQAPQGYGQPRPMQQAPQGYGQPQPMQQTPQGYGQPRPMQQAPQGYGQPRPMQQTPQGYGQPRPMQQTPQGYGQPQPVQQTVPQQNENYGGAGS